jgi:hypothetical protein
MFKSNWKVFGSIAAAIILVVSFLVIAQPRIVLADSLGQGGGPGGRGGNGTGGNGTVPGTGTSLTPLSESEKDALTQAILEEYGALNLYKEVIDQLGSVAPFDLIVRAEQQHINALSRQTTKYGVAIPTNPGLTTAPTFTTLNDACKAGVAAEIADANLFDELKPMVTHTDILQVFNNLQYASLNSHLPSFQACQ